MTPSNAIQPKKKKHARSRFYRIAAWLHLWLGLVTGAVMVVVCLTGAVWIFNDEITALIYPETKIAKQGRPVLSPSRLKKIAEARFPGERASYASYQQGRAAYVGLGEARKATAVLRINPYTGQIVQVRETAKDGKDFFRIILDGHRHLWLPRDIGKPIINYSTLIFVLILVTGVVMWWPRRWTRAAKKQAFTIKRGASFKRLNYDLHNVLGFYSLIVLAVIAMTGIVYGIEWWSKGLYWTTSGGQHLSEAVPPKSDSTQAGLVFSKPTDAMDAAWNRVVAENRDAQGFYYAYANKKKPSEPISIFIYPSAGQFYNRRNYLFDQHTLKPLTGNKVFDGPYEKASAPDKLRRMNYDLHVGSILGWPGRILAFFAALIGASLPVTGFIVWLGKKRKAKRRTPKHLRETRRMWRRTRFVEPALQTA